MADIELYVDPTLGGPSGGDGSPGNPYGTITEAHTDAVATYSNLVGDQNRIFFRCLAGLDDLAGQRLLVEGWTSDATYKLFITAASGEEHLGVIDGGYILRTSTINATIANQEFLEIDDIQIKNDYSGNFGNCIYNDNAGNLILRRIIFGDTCGVSNAITQRGDLFAYASLFFEPRLLHKDGAIAQIFPASILRNCTFAKVNQGALHNNWVASSEVHNCVSVTPAAPQDFIGGMTADYNASGDATAPGTTVYHNIDETTAFTDYANNDFTIPTGSVLIDAGDVARLPPDGLDITRTPYATADIGCYAAVSAGPGDLALDGTFSGAATASSWDLSEITALSGTLNGVATADAWDTNLELSLSGTLAGIGTADAWELAGEDGLKATLAGAAAIDWDLGTSVALAGTYPGIGTAQSWTLGWSASMVVSLVGTATNDWDLVLDEPDDGSLRATWTGVATASSWLLVPEHPLSTTLAGVGIADGWNLSPGGSALSATWDALATADSWSVSTVLTLSGTLPGTSSQDWDFSSDDRLRATWSGAATSTCELIPTYPLSTALAAMASVDWGASIDSPLVGILQGIGTAEDWRITRGGLDIDIYETSVRDVTPWRSVHSFERLN